MLFIFRKLRKSFFLPGKVRTYFAYAVGEVVLIVVGILIAVEIGDRNQARKDRVEETGILIQLKADFERNQKQLLQNESLLTHNISQMVSFLAIMGPQPDTYPDELIHSYVGGLRFVPRYIPITSAMDSASASGRMSLIKNENLSMLLSFWLRRMERYQESINTMLEEDLIVWEFISDHHQFRDSRIGKPKGQETGPSKFGYDQSKLLANPKLENFVESKRINADFTLIDLRALEALQQGILDLIDAELAKRGIESNN